MRFVYRNQKKHSLSHQIFVAFGGVIKGPLTTIIGVILIINGFIFLQILSPTFWSMAVGLPLALLGVSIFIMGIYAFFASIFSFGYSISHCPFCKSPVILKDHVWEKWTCPECKKKFNPAKNHSEHA
ncbi:hypothetical protein A2Z23_01770 [Candidatus Curtissbacteria bacterium RBG_16_39_7]|uniref:Uncharacterized protein n=1 Tax=Candidatus Curtissbacteria bacterium RBG_16_39_7 TaxID=1797707 RepID=A0A1F5G279_9BACT|nr:MAG: hypothetical protein A2Z23_01770 [Candidatus Curtissbacteria bacterium RBG_16_39_7]